MIPYFIAAHPGTTDEDMMNLAVWLKQNDFRVDQVQTFLPTPMAIATAMYHTRRNPLRKISRDRKTVEIVRSGKIRRLHKAFLRYHDPENWPMLREALQRMGRTDLIGNGKHHLIPTWQPATDGSYQSARRRTRPPSPTRGKAPMPSAKASTGRRSRCRAASSRSTPACPRATTAAARRAPPSQAPSQSPARRGASHQR